MNVPRSSYSAEEMQAALEAKDARIKELEAILAIKNDTIAALRQTRQKETP